MENKPVSSNPVEYETPNALAAIWSMMLPGLGQLTKGRVMPGILWAIIVGCGYFSYFWPGLILHGFCILDAGFSNPNTWQKRLGLFALITLLLTYIVIRNTYY